MNVTIDFDNKRHQFQYGTGECTEDGKQWVYNYLDSLNLPPLPNHWDWNMIVPKGEYCGTMPKRLKKYYHKIHNITLSSEILSNFGSRITEFIDNPKLYEFRFTLDHWNSGDFQDHGSCFWGCRWYAPKIIRQHGGGAIQFFQPETDIGTGRAWLIPYNNTWVIINGYGVSLLFIGRLVSTYLGCTYKHIDVHNNEVYDGPIYINNGKGIILGEYNHNELDLDINISKYINKCSCGEYTFEKYCASCIQRLQPCVRCGSTILMSAHSNVHVCNECVIFLRYGMSTHYAQFFENGSFHALS